MRFNFILFLFFCAGITQGQHSNPFFSLNYDKVIMYDFESEEADPNIIRSDGQLAKKIHRQVTLNTAVISALYKKLEDPSSFGGGTRNCYIPHLGIVYYLKNVPVAQINICMDCNRIFSNLPLLGKKYGRIYTGAASYYLKDDGMSKSFRHFLTKLLKEKNFSHRE